MTNKMTRKTIAFAVVLMALSSIANAAAPVVSNVTAHQRIDGSKNVDIYYNVSDPDTATFTVSVMVSSDGGGSYTISASSVSGDVGSNVPRGTGKHIVWNAGTDLPGAYGTNYKVSVTASDSVYSGQMIYIPAGSFLMGNSNVGNDAVYRNSSELPQHSVSLAAYSIGKYEVTRGEYRAFINAGGYSNSAYWSSAGWTWKGSKTQPSYYWVDPVNWGTPPGSFSQGDSRPVVGVTYYEAEAFCNWAGGHLPTEAQWERAARWTGSHPNVYPWGDTWDAQKCNTWYDSLYPGYQTAPVGSYSSYGSPSGCQDMAGNVYEWCKDWYGETYYSTSPSSDPQGPTSGDYGYRVLRGGSWGYGPNGDSYRCAYRGYYYPYPNGYDGVNFGFRLAR